MTQTQLESAQLLMSQGQYQKAINTFDIVLAVEPTSVDAWTGVSLCYTSMGKWLEALNAIVNALGYGGYHQHQLVVLLQILEACQLNSYVEPIEKALHKALEHRWLEGQAVSFLVSQLLLKYKDILAQSIDSIELNEPIEKMLLDETLVAVVSRQIVPNHALEKVLLLGRKELLQCFAHNQDARHYLPIISAIACQNLLNDGLYHTDEQELQWLAMLDNTDKVFALEVLALKLSYANFEQALTLWEQHKDLFKFTQMKSLGEDLAFYHQLQTEQSKKAVQDETSKVVQSFYMQNPYPKYKVVKVNTMTIGQHMERIGLKNVSKPEILVAGCGTGLQAIELAFANRDGKVTAIDISPTSLQYGKLMAKRYGLKNIKFKLLDILKVNELKKKFDYIVSTGVLHHMQDPQAGLNALSGVLKPERAMVLGLYARASRQVLGDIKNDVIDFFADKAPQEGDEQQEIEKHQLSQWRSSWTDKERAEHWYNTNDFFHLNGLMDAIFHPHEVMYSLMDLRPMLNEAGVVFKSMAVTKQMTARYAEQLAESPMPHNRETLFYWHGFEQKNPQFFAGTYNFFVVKM